MTALEKALNAIKNGQFMRITYKVSLPVKSEFKKLGVTVEKLASTTVRTGINFKNIKSVIEEQHQKELNGAPEPSGDPRTSNFEWVVKNRIKYNSKTEKQYLVFATVPKHSFTDAEFIVGTTVGAETVSKDTLDKSLIIDSYWTKKSTPVFMVATENIIAINGTRI